MIKKEFRDIASPSLGRLIPVLIIPILSILQVPLKMVFYVLFIRAFRFITGAAEDIVMVGATFVLGLCILLVANFCGNRGFRYEHNDGAFEYLLSFPFSRWRILLNKLIPRLGVLAVLTLVYEVLAIVYISPLRSIKGPLFFLIDPVFFPMWVLFIFLTGFFLGIFEQKNWIPVVVLAVLWSAIIFSIWLRSLLKGLMETGGSYLTGMAFSLGTVLVLMILATGFLLVFRKFDMKDMSIYSKRFAAIVLPPLGILIIAGLAGVIS